MADKIKTAATAVRAANAECQAVRSACSKEIQEAEKEIRERWASKIQATDSARNEAERALREAENAAVNDHPWQGRKVVKRTPNYASRWSSRVVGYHDTFGIVETYRHGADVGSLPYYKIPNPGHPLVRLLKKSGEPGKRVVVMRDHENWKLVEGDPA